jgi:hypothetical protein
VKKGQNRKGDWKLGKKRGNINAKGDKIKA